MRLASCRQGIEKIMHKSYQNPDNGDGIRPPKLVFEPPNTAFSQRRLH